MSISKADLIERLKIMMWAQIGNRMHPGYADGYDAALEDVFEIVEALPDDSRPEPQYKAGYLPDPE